jgi:hypothetical protein
MTPDTGASDEARTRTLGKAPTEQQSARFVA